MISKKTIAVATAVVIFAGVMLFYFTVISPLTAKPELTKPALAEGQNVSSEHIEWVVNELGGYKLQPTAQIELIVEENKFTVTTKDGKIVSAQGAASDPDLRITANREAFIKILNANNTNAEIISLYNQGAISVELLKDQATLALKGYKGIYDMLQGG